MQQMILAEDWRLKQRDPARDLAADAASSDDWRPARVPGTVHEALLAAGRIPDPFNGLNEQAVQWVGEQDWLYRCDFEVGRSFLAEGPISLCCDGLDTVATVWLNGQEVLRSENMFVPLRVPVSALLRPGPNELLILFRSALRYGKECEAEWGVRRAWNGDPSRVYVRKAQYHYGWDWGPCLLTAGPWQAVRLEAGAARIAELHCPIEVAADLSRATLPVEVTVKTEPAGGVGEGMGYSVRLELRDPDGATIGQAAIPVAQDGVARHSFSVDSPALWWPHSYGEQPRYSLRAGLVEGGTVLDLREIRVGIRRLRLLQEPLADEPGASFLFEINNTPVFCGGANWIPADSFTTRLTPRDYRLQIEQAAAAHMVMLRVWGGGIYEDDAFYDCCDELGLMVWQDFMFACGIYPAHPAFQDSVRAEAEAQVRRLRHHPSVVLWCGNNEDYQIAESIQAYDAGFEGDFTTTRFPARAIYERLLPEICGRLDPTRAYWPGSPYGGSSVADQTVGDRHTWDIWHGAMEQYAAYPRYEGRFVSEFGMQSCPAVATIAAVVPPEERYPQSRTMDHHNKSSDGPRRLAAYLNDTLRVRDTLEDYVYATQFVQAEAMGAAYRGWRRRWLGSGRYYVAGALVWQLNDCWPVISWAIVDYARRPKPAYYVIRRELAALAIGLAESEGGASVWAVNGTQAAVTARIEVQGYTLDGSTVFSHEQSAVLGPNRVTEIETQVVGREMQVVAAARLHVGGEVVARATLWPEPFKYLTLPDPAITIERCGADRVRVQATRPAKGVWLMAGDDVVWSDNMLDLVPGDPQVVHAMGLGDRQVQAQWLRSS